MSKILIKPLKRDAILQVSYLYGGVVTFQPGESLGPRILTDYELVLIIEGHVNYRCKETEYSAPPGTVILSRPGFHEMYRWDPHAETRHAYFHFNLDAIPRDWPPPDRWPIVNTKPVPVISALFSHVVQSCAEHPAWPTERPTRDICRMIESLITLLLRGSHESSTNQQARPQPVQQALQWIRQMIDEEPSRSIRLDNIANAANVSPKHLCRLFGQSLECSPMKVCRLLRLRLAVVLLSRSNLSIKQIGIRCGFASPFQFSHCFSQEFGQSPMHMRHQISSTGAAPPVIPLPADLMPRVYW